MTKRYLETLPQDEQDAILGAPDPDDAPVCELKPGLQRCEHRMIYTGHQCQLAEGHTGRHAWEESWVRRVAEIEGVTQ